MGAWGGGGPIRYSWFVPFLVTWVVNLYLLSTCPQMEHTDDHLKELQTDNTELKQTLKEYVSVHHCTMYMYTS